MSAVAEQDLSTVPGAMEIEIVRELPDGGVVDFAEAPVGWLKKDGEPRKRAYRAYHYTPPAARRGRLVSVTGMLDDCFPKPGVPPWSEAEGIKGAVRAATLGLIGPNTTPEEAVEIVRQHKLGAEETKREAAERGTDLHGIGEEYMRTGSVPRLSDVRPELRGYASAFSKFVLLHEPEPVAVEQLVVNPPEKYAGRVDLRAYIEGRRDRLATIDYKSQTDGKSYESAIYQVNLYELGAVACGEPPADELYVAVFADDGKFRLVDARIEGWRVDAMLSHYRGRKPIAAACESANRVEREARKAVSA